MKSFVYSDIFEALGEIDTTEGRGGQYHIGYFTARIDAERAAEHAGVMGTPGTVKKLDLAVRIFENIVEFRMQQKADKRRTALSKLTAEEQALLGLLEVQP